MNLCCPGIASTWSEEYICYGVFACVDIRTARPGNYSHSPPQFSSTATRRRRRSSLMNPACALICINRISLRSRASDEPQVPSCRGAQSRSLDEHFCVGNNDSLSFGSSPVAYVEIARALAQSIMASTDFGQGRHSASHLRRSRLWCI